MAHVAFIKAGARKPNSRFFELIVLYFQYGSNDPDPWMVLDLFAGVWEIH